MMKAAKALERLLKAADDFTYAVRKRDSMTKRPVTGKKRISRDPTSTAGAAMGASR
jgi:hypothetical protein